MDMVNSLRTLSTYEIAKKNNEQWNLQIFKNVDKHNTSKDNVS